METLILLLDAIAIAVLVFTSLRNDRLPPGRQPTGPFRYVVGTPPAGTVLTGRRGAPGPGRPDLRS